MPTQADALAVRDLLRAKVQASRPPTTLLDVAAKVLPGYHPRKHTDYLASVLTDAITQAEHGENVRIIVEMPPGEGKSSICSVAAPLYALSRNPDWEIASVSAEASLANKWSRDCRRAVTDGHIDGVHIQADSKAQTEWETTAGGSFIARGVGGQITGRRIRFLALDDPVRDWAAAHSRVKRDALWDTWQSVLKTRLRPGSVVVLVMTRWHEDDLAGRLIDAGGWLVVKLPAIAETAGDAIGREIGEPLLSPQTDETPKQALERWEQTRLEVGTYVWDALYQQRPAPPGGAVFKTDWWGELPPPPKFERIVTSWDLTFGSLVGDFAVGQVWGQVGPDLWLLDQVRGRWSFNEQVHQIESLAERWPDATAHLIEKAAGGGPAIETLQHKLSGVIPIPVNSSKGGKEIRAQAVAPMVEAGNVHLPESVPWLDDFHSEVAGFPNSAPHDDIVDAMTQALDWMRVPHTGMVSTNPAIQRLPSRAGGFRGRSF